MAEIKIDLDKIMKDAVAESTRVIASRIKVGVEGKMQELFMAKNVQQFHKDRGKFTPGMGFATNAIATAVEDYITSTDFDRKVLECIAANIDAAIERATLDAMNHRCRKEAFEKVKKMG